jgi:hypothetical protein
MVGLPREKCLRMSVGVLLSNNYFDTELGVKAEKAYRWRIAR